MELLIQEKSHHEHGMPTDLLWSKKRNVTRLPDPPPPYLGIGPKYLQFSLVLPKEWLWYDPKTIEEEFSEKWKV